MHMRITAAINGKGERMPADLHCHTKMSDGCLSIEEIVLLAKRRGITTISVTDHDTFAGSTRAKIFGDRRGVKVHYDNFRYRP